VVRVRVRQAIVSEVKESGEGKPGRGKNGNRKRLGDNLRMLYDEVVNEPVPQEMLDLLARLKDDRK